jgi:hypothetical protein
LPSHSRYGDWQEVVDTLPLELPLEELAWDEETPVPEEVDTKEDAVSDDEDGASSDVAPDPDVACDEGTLEVEFLDVEAEADVEVDHGSDDVSALEPTWFPEDDDGRGSAPGSGRAQ